MSSKQPKLLDMLTMKLRELKGALEADIEKVEHERKMVINRLRAASGEANPDDLECGKRSLDGLSDHLRQYRHLFTNGVPARITAAIEQVSSGQQCGSGSTDRDRNKPK